MAETKPEDLKKAYRKERDSGVRARMAAVNAVCVKKVDVGKTADCLMQCPDRVSHWARAPRGGWHRHLRDLSGQEGYEPLPPENRAQSGHTVANPCLRGQGA